MEDFLIAILQCSAEIIGGLLEFIGQCIVEGFNLGLGSDLIEWIGRLTTDLLGSFYGAWPTMSANSRASWIGAFYFFVGLVAGAASLHFCHDVLFRKSAIGLMTLGLGPIVSGTVSWLTAKCRLLLGATTRPSYHFWWIFLFALGLCLVRFGFGHRPEM